VTASPQVRYEEATADLIAARLAYAEAFLRFKTRRNITDGQAAHMAYVETKGAVDAAEARQLVARWYLDRSR
jgi:hypothetical protein